MKDMLITAAMVGSAGWLFWNVSELKVTAGRIEVAVSTMEGRDLRITALERRLGRLERH